MNQQLQKLADEASKTCGAWRKQMQRDGYTKREQLDPSQAQTSSMKPAALALFSDYKKAQAALDREAADPSQKGLGFDDNGGGDNGGGGAAPQGKAKGGAKQANGKTPPAPDPKPDLVSTPEGMTRIEVSADRLDSIIGITAGTIAGLSKKKPAVKELVEIEGIYYVPVAHTDGSGFVTLNRVVPMGDWHGNTVASAKDIPEDSTNLAGLVFKVAGEEWVLTDEQERVAVIAGNPLGGLQLHVNDEGGEKGEGKKLEPDTTPEGGTIPVNPNAGKDKTGTDGDFD